MKAGISAIAIICHDFYSHLWAFFIFLLWLPMDTDTWQTINRDAVIILRETTQILPELTVCGDATTQQ